jgi:hypothetical protein
MAAIPNPMNRSTHPDRVTAVMEPEAILVTLAMTSLCVERDIIQRRTDDAIQGNQGLSM